MKKLLAWLLILVLLFSLASCAGQKPATDEADPTEAAPSGSTETPAPGGEVKPVEPDAVTGSGTDKTEDPTAGDPGKGTDPGKTTDPVDHPVTDPAGKPGEEPDPTTEPKTGKNGPDALDPGKPVVTEPVPAPDPVPEPPVTTGDDGALYVTSTGETAMAEEEAEGDFWDGLTSFGKSMFSRDEAEAEIAMDMPAYESFAMVTDSAKAASGGTVAPGAYGPSYDYGGVDAIPTEEPAPEPGDVDGPIWADDPVEPDIVIEPVMPYEPDPGDAFVLTAAEWNDNRNWPFFTNLVSSGRISFPSFGLEPQNRVKVTVEGGGVYPVSLTDVSGTVLWTAKTDRDGVAYLFFRQKDDPYAVRLDSGVEVVLDTTEVEVSDGTAQGTPKHFAQEVTLPAPGSAGEVKRGLQVMFIVDTTGSMSDEIAYLQKDFSSIAEDVGTEGVAFSACFYRDEGDEYVTRLSEFTTDVAAVQSLINSEYATGGGDFPEAVAQVLDETLSMSFMNEDGHNGWLEDTEKLAFIIFDAPPHGGTDETITAAVRRAAEAGIRVVPVICSNGERETELFGRALAIMTGGTYVFLTDDSGVGGSHLEPIIGAHDVELLHDIIVRIIENAKPEY